MEEGFASFSGLPASVLAWAAKWCLPHWSSASMVVSDVEARSHCEPARREHARQHADRDARVIQPTDVRFRSGGPQSRFLLWRARIRRRELVDSPGCFCHCCCYRSCGSDSRANTSPTPSSSTRTFVLFCVLPMLAALAVVRQRNARTEHQEPVTALWMRRPRLRTRVEARSTLANLISRHHAASLEVRSVQRGLDVARTCGYSGEFGDERLEGLQVGRDTFENEVDLAREHPAFAHQRLARTILERLEVGLGFGLRGAPSRTCT